MSRKLSFVILLFALVLPATAQRQYPLRQYLSIRSAASPTISPDGTQVAFTTGITGTAQVWKVGRNGGWPSQMTFFNSGVNSVHWSPEGDNLIIIADTDGNEQFQFYSVMADGTSITPLTDNPKVRHAYGGLSADGTTLFYASNARDNRWFDCYLMDRKTGQSRLVYQKDSVLDAAALSPDKKTLIASESTSNVNEELYAVNVETGQGRHLTPHRGDALFRVIGFLPDNRTLLVATDKDREFINLATIDISNGSTTFLQDEKADVTSAILSPSGKILAYTTNREGYGDVTLLDTRTMRPIRLPKMPRGIVTPGDFSANSKYLSLVLNTPTKNSDVWVLDIPAGRLQQSTQSSLAGIDASTLVEPTLIKYKSFDGLEIPAFLYLPKNAPQNKSISVILSVHGGPEAQERPLFASIYQYFLSRGFAVLAPNIRGSSGYGKTYLALDNARKRWDALKDLNAAVDWIGTHPALNSSKVAIYGGSYGGFAVLAMLTHYPERFAAGVDVVGISDFKTFLANTAPFRRPLRIAEYGDPEKDSEFMDAISPALHVAQIKSPLFVIQGRNDPRVPYTEAEQIVQKVKAKGGTVEYILFPDEGHGVAKFPNRVRYFEQMITFLNKYLK